MIAKIPDDVVQVIIKVGKEITPNLRPGYFLAGLVPADEQTGFDIGAFTGEVRKGLERVGLPEDGWYVSSHVSRGITFYYAAVKDQYSSNLVDDIKRIQMAGYREQFYKEAPKEDGWSFLSMWSADRVPPQFGTEEKTKAFLLDQWNIPPDAVRFDSTVDRKGRPAFAIMVKSAYESQAKAFVDAAIEKAVVIDMDRQEAKMRAMAAQDQDATFTMGSTGTHSYGGDFAKDTFDKDKPFMAPPSKYSH